MSCLLLTALASAAAAPDGPGSATRGFRFDNGAGLSGSATHYRFNSRHGDLYPHNGTPVSRFLLHRRLDAGALHYGGTVSEDEHHYYGGATLGSATVAWFRGEAESLSKASNPLYGDLNQYFFHGGRRSTFEFEGAALSLALGDGLSTRVALSTVTAPDAGDRHGYYAGIAGRRFQAGVFQFQRGGDPTGRGLNLAVSAGALELKYQQIRSVHDAGVRRLAFQWRSGASQSLSVELEKLENDLYARAGEQRVMLRFRKSFGPVPAFAAAGERDEEGGREGFGRSVGIGVGLGVAAAALSSGGDNDGTRRFAVRNDAAFAVLNRVNPRSVRQNREHGGWIFRNADNTFASTKPVAGTVNSVNIGSPATAVPAGTRASASYHTHGGPDPRFDNENFSPRDIVSDRRAGTDGYLGTPAGFMKLHDRETGSISVVGRINN